MVIKCLSESDESLNRRPEGNGAFFLYVSPTCLFMLVLPLCLKASLCVKTLYTASHTRLTPSMLVWLCESTAVTQQSQLLGSSQLICTSLLPSVSTERVLCCYLQEFYLCQKQLCHSGPQLAFISIFLTLSNWMFSLRAPTRQLWSCSTS